MDLQELAQESILLVNNHPPTLPRYASTPWSQRELSSTPATSTPTQATPAPPARPIPQLIVESIETPQNRKKRKTQVPPIRQESDKTLVLRICYRLKDLYGRVSMTKF